MYAVPTVIVLANILSVVSASLSFCCSVSDGCASAPALRTFPALPAHVTGSRIRTAGRRINLTKTSSKCAMQDTKHQAFPAPLL